MALSFIPDAGFAKATFDQWWTFASTLLGAVVGSIVGGVISYVLARQSNRNIAKQNAIECRNRDKALAFSLIIKVGEVVSSLGALHHQIEKAIATSEAAGVTGMLWSKMIPIVGSEKRINFTSEEIAALLPLKMNSAINTLFVLGSHHNTLHSVMELYGRKRFAFGERFGADMNGSVGSTAVTREQYLLASPLMAEMEALAIQLREGSKEWFEKASKTFSEVASALEAHFSDVSFPKFKLAEYGSTESET